MNINNYEKAVILFREREKLDLQITTLEEMLLKKEEKYLPRIESEFHLKGRREFNLSIPMDSELYDIMIDHILGIFRMKLKECEHKIKLL